MGALGAREDGEAHRGGLDEGDRAGTADAAENGGGKRELHERRRGSIRRDR